MADKHIFEDADQFKEYFKDDELALNAIIERLKTLESICNTQIDSISSVPGSKGVQHYLIEHMANAISIESQMQSVLKDKKAIKEKALDLAIRQANGENIGDSDAVLASLQALIRDERQKGKIVVESLESEYMSSTDLDKEIEKKLGI